MYSTYHNEPKTLATVRPRPTLAKHLNCLVSGSQGLPLAGFLRQMETSNVPRSFYSTELPTMRASLTELFASSNSYHK